MSLKNKFAIGLIIILAILTVLAINALSVTIQDEHLPNLAWIATYDPNRFINQELNTWLNQTISQGPATDITINYKSGMCMYHRSGSYGIDETFYRLSHIIDFDFVDGVFQVKWNGNTRTIDASAGTLIKELYNAYVNGADYSTTYYTEHKRKALWAFHQAVNNSANPLIPRESNTFSYDIDEGRLPLSSDINASMTYGNNMVAYRPLSKMSQDSEITMQHSDGYTMIGPFKVNYAVREIDKIGVYSDSSTLEAVTGGQIYYTTYHKSFDTIGNITDAISNPNILSNNLSLIAPGVEFYIVVPDQSQGFSKGNNLKITIYQKPMEAYKGRLLLAERRDQRSQNVGIFAVTKKGDNESISQVTFIPQNKPVDLTVIKLGKDSVKLEGVKFYLRNDSTGTYYAKWTNKQEGANGEKIYSGITFETNYIDTSNSEVAESYLFETGKQGKMIINGLNVSTIYSLQEIINPNDGYTDIDIKNALLSNGVASIVLKNTDESNNRTNNLVTGIQLSSTQSNTLEVIDKDETGGFDIIINKINSSKTKVKGAQFKIKVLDGSRTIGWLYCDNTEHKDYIYYKNYNSSSIWNTAKKDEDERIDGNIVYSKEQGIIEILNLDAQYNYEIYETKPAEGYLNLYAHTLYGVDTKIDGTKKILYRESYVYDYSAVKCGTVSYEAHGSSVTVEVTNVHAPDDPEYVDISGVIWMDRDIKTSNNRFDNGEGLSGVTVYLRNADSTAEKAKTTTNSNGVYTFKGSSTRLTSDDLEDYYIEIAYNGIGTNYRITEYGTGNNYSKAKYQSAGVAGTDSIDSSYRMHMNIGLRPISKDTQSVEKWVDNVKVIMKGNEYTYRYGKDNTSVGGGATVGIGNASYYRTIYASDIAYSLEENVTDGLQVYITYKIKVNNDTSTYQPAQVVGNKKEEHMTVTLQDEYDSSCYELHDNNWSGSNGVATYKSSFNLNRARTSGYTRTIPITFKLTDGKKNTTRNVLKKILNDGSFTAGNKVSISGKHQYQEYISYRVRVRRTRTVNGKRRSYYVWVTRYKWETKYLSYEEENYAPGMTFSINEYGSDTVLERTISGKVFEDTNIMPQSDGQILGNGLYDNSATRKESIIQNVVVELLYANTNKVIGQGIPAKRYEYNKSDGQVHIKTQSINTLNDGTYIFTGMVPGDYYVRFTYGNGVQRILKMSSSGMEPVRAYYYKSTIVKNSTLKNLIKKDGKRQLYSDNEYYWYRNISSDGWSTAVDILGDRENLNSQNSLTYNIRAYTPTLRIGLENESATSGENKAKIYNIENINFGIIDTPKVSLGFEKKMTNIKVTNSQGNVLIDGNPETVDESIKYLSDLDDKEYLTQGSDYAKIEINDNEIYGAKLEIEYSITVINNSDINYYERAGSQYYGYYYMFGEIYSSAAENHKTREVNITINKVYDYLDNKLTFTGEKDHGISNENTYKNNDSVLYIDDNWKPIYSQIRAATNSRPTQDIAKFKVTRTLSNTESDMNFENYAIVQYINVTDNPRLVEDLNIHGTTENKTVNTMKPSTEDVKYTNYFDYSKSGVTFANLSEVNSLTVVPPTGYDMLTPIIYIMVITIAGIIITIGIIVIKKKVI